jgi:tRNA A22 N-methylase
VYFVVCTLAVKKKNQGRFRHVGSDHSLVRRGLQAVKKRTVSCLFGESNTGPFQLAIYSLYRLSYPSGG